MMFPRFLLLALLTLLPAVTPAQDPAVLFQELKQELEVDDAHMEKVLGKMRRELPAELKKHALWFGMHLASKMAVLSASDFKDAAKMKRITERNTVYVELLKKTAGPKDVHDNAAGMARAFELAVEGMREGKLTNPELRTALNLPEQPTEVDLAKGLGRRMNAYLTLIGLPPEARRE